MKGHATTIRVKMVSAATFVVAIALLATALLFLFLLQRSLQNNVYNSARTRVEEVALLTQKTELPLTLPDSGEKGAVIQVVNGGGNTVAASAQVIPGSRLSELNPVLGDFLEESRSDLPITGDQTDDPFHVVAFGAQTPRGRITAYVALSLDGVHESVAAAKKTLQISFPILLLIVAVASWFFVGAALRPVDLMRRKVSEIGDGDLSHRIPEPPVDDEIGRLARSMNLMLDRLQDASDRQRRFVADASHELQSPLAASLADLEVALAHPPSAHWENIAASLVEDNHRMTRLVADLLFLAKSDNGVKSAQFTAVDLDDVVRAEVLRLQPRSPVGIDLALVAPVEVRGSADQLARVVRNLLENAVRYADSLVVVEVRRDEGVAELVVHDDGPGIDPSQRDRVFDRFARLDDSRSRHSGGSGLGLSIVREILDGHQGTVSIVSSDRGARFVVQLPLPDAA